MLQQAIDYYHELLTDEVAAETDATMRAKLKERSLYFGERPLCVVLRPHFYTETHWAFLQNGLETLLGAFKIAHDACLMNADLRAQLYLDDYEEALIPHDKAGVPPWTSSRLDTFYLPEKGELKCVEYNAETPAGIGYADNLSAVFEQLEPIKAFGKRHPFRTIKTLGTLTDAVIDGYRAWGGATEKPQIAIVDWREVPTLNEHEITRKYFMEMGYKTILADPRHLEYRDGKLWFEDFRIDIIYKRVLYSELHKNMGMDNPIIQAIRDGNIFITNSISAKMMSKKASLAFLSDESNAHLFNQAQLQSIASFIPWTRVVQERKTVYDGQEVDFMEFVSENRDRFALKPNDDYGGAGVMLGWEASSEQWDTALQQALKTPHVVQERVTVSKRDFPMWINDHLDISPRFVDADPYIFNGTSVGGILTRLSPLALLNVTAGGGSIVPTLIIRDNK